MMSIAEARELVSINSPRGNTRTRVIGGIMIVLAVFVILVFGFGSAAGAHS